MGKLKSGNGAGKEEVNREMVKDGGDMVED